MIPLSTLQLHCHCYSLSKSIEFVNFRNDFRCLVIRSCLLIGQIPCFSVSFSSISLCCWSRVKWYSKWSIVWSPLLQGHVALSNNLNRCREALVLPCPDTIAVKFEVMCIFDLSLLCWDRIVFFELPLDFPPSFVAILAWILLLAPGTAYSKVFCCRRLSYLWPAPLSWPVDQPVRFRGSLHGPWPLQKLLSSWISPIYIVSLRISSIR